MEGGIHFSERGCDLGGDFPELSLAPSTPHPLCDGLPFMPLARPGSPSAGLANCSTWSPNASQGAEDLKYPVFVGDSLGRLVSGVHTH